MAYFAFRIGGVRVQLAGAQHRRVAAALYPSVKAARLEPLETLRLG